MQQAIRLQSVFLGIPASLIYNCSHAGRLPGPCQHWPRPFAPFLRSHKPFPFNLGAHLEAAACHAEELRQEAEKTQTELVPPNRQMFTWTPPISGFSEQQADRGRRRRGR